MKFAATLLTTASLLASAALGQEVTDASSKKKPLAAGDPAPALQVTGWVKGEAVHAFAAGRIYVVEFWATWCGPCIASIPHLDRIQEEHGDRLTVIGVSNQDPNNSLEEVRELVAARGDAMGYTVAFDAARKTFESWMSAAGRDGIPCAFVVDGEGKLAWVGHPMLLDVPIEGLLEGTWDPVAGAKALDEVMDAIDGVYASEGHAQMLERIAKFEEAHPDLADLVARPKFSALLGAGMLDAAYALGSALADQAIEEKDPSTLNLVAWSIVDPGVALVRRDLGLAKKAADAAVELTARKDANVLDTLARVYYLRGDLEMAITTQKEAVALAPKSAGLAATLRQYEAAR